MSKDPSLHGVVNQQQTVIKPPAAQKTIQGPPGPQGPAGPQGETGPYGGPKEAPGLLVLLDRRALRKDLPVLRELPVLKGQREYKELPVSLVPQGREVHKDLRGLLDLFILFRLVF